jgi:hypothetical protein
VSGNDYRAHAEECLRMASEVTNQAAASWFRLLAADYLELAEQEISQGVGPVPVTSL